jgi:hypothetical protein
MAPELLARRLRFAWLSRSCQRANGAFRLIAALGQERRSAFRADRPHRLVADLPHDLALVPPLAMSGGLPPGDRSHAEAA